MATAAALGINPSSSSPVNGVGGSSASPTAVLDELDLPRTDGGIIQFGNVPIHIMNLPDGLDGVIGMNLLEKADAMLYDPTGPKVSFTFPSSSETTMPINGGNPAMIPVLQQHGVPFAQAVHGSNLPALQVTTGEIRGRVFLDYNGDGIDEASEPGLADQVVYLDLNHDGQLDSNDITTRADANGNYQFTNLIPGDYAVRLLTPASYVPISPNGGSSQVSVQSAVISDGVNLGAMPTEADANSAFIANLYGSILDRGVDATGLNYWLWQLANGTTREQAASQVWQSAEHRAVQIAGYYQRYLNRGPDAAAMNYWLGVFQSGATEVGVQSTFIASGEFQAAHPNQTTFLTAVYTDVLGRAAGAGDLSYWQQQMNQGMTAGQVAAQILTSNERYQNALDQFYQAFLHRTPGAGESSYWLGLLDGGQTVDAVASAILASGEYYSWAQQLVS
jgi:hypothetical protein